VAINERQRSAKVHGFNFNEPADPFSRHEKGSLHCFAIAVGEMGKRRGYKGESDRVQQTYRIKSDTVKSPQAATAVVALQRQSAWTPALRKNLGQI